MYLGWDGMVVLRLDDIHEILTLCMFHVRVICELTKVFRRKVILGWHMYTVCVTSISKFC